MEIQHTRFSSQRYITPLHPLLYYISNLQNAIDKLFLIDLSLSPRTFNPSSAHFLQTFIQLTSTSPQYGHHCARIESRLQP